MAALDSEEGRWSLWLSLAPGHQFSLGSFPAGQFLFANKPQPVPIAFYWE